MTHPSHESVRARLRTHLWLTPLIVFPIGWLFRKAVLVLLFIAGVGLAYYVGIAILYVWALRRPDKALGAGTEAPASPLDRVLGLATIALGLATVLIAFWGIGEWDITSRQRTAALSSSFQARMLVGLAVTLALTGIIWYRAKYRPRRVEFFGQAGLSVVLAVVGLTSIAGSGKVLDLLARVDGPPPRVVDLDGWRSSPPQIASATEVVSEDGSQILFAIRMPMERSGGCAPMQAMDAAKFMREARVESRHALPDLQGVECRMAAVLVAPEVREQVEAGILRCSDSDGILFAYRWVGNRAVPPDELPRHLSCDR